MKYLHIANSYNTWSKDKMKKEIDSSAYIKYESRDPEKLLNRTYKSMYIEWLWHNVGYYLTLPFIHIESIAKINKRFKHVDLEEK